MATTVSLRGPKRSRTMTSLFGITRSSRPSWRTAWQFTAAMTSPCRTISSPIPSPREAACTWATASMQYRSRARFLWIGTWSCAAAVSIPACISGSAPFGCSLWIRRSTRRSICARTAAPPLQGSGQPASRNRPFEAAAPSSLNGREQTAGSAARARKAAEQGATGRRRGLGRRVGEAPEKAVLVPRRAVRIVGDLQRQAAHDFLKTRRRREVNGLIGVVRRRGVTLSTPVFEYFLLGRPRIKTDLHREGGNTLLYEAVLIAADE